MTKAQIWWLGARPKTLGAAISPVLIGSALAFNENSFNTYLALLALIVSLSIQIGVNYANDYSDGIRGTDEDRVGPVRLVGQKLASAKSVKFAAFIFFVIAGIAGTLLTIATQQWWFFILGIAAIAAAWTYTGGPKPYGYSGFGEVFVFVFFGLVAVLGTVYSQTLFYKPFFIFYAIYMGCFASAILVANNLRDLEKDEVNNKRTLAVKIGDKNTRNLYITLILTPFIISVLLFIFERISVDQDFDLGYPINFVAFIFAWQTIKIVNNKAKGKELIPVLIKTGQTQLLFTLLSCLALIV
jgi:1,4-dihydroxy-2-naphthoate octaprenyltransferase